MPPSEHWKQEPEEHDYPAAEAYLSLVLPEGVAAHLVEKLKAAPLEHRKAKDLLRASGLALLPEKNVHVAADLHKIDKGEALSPVLLLRGDARRSAALQVADGYHRICASYLLDEDADIPCRIVDLPD